MDYKAVTGHVFSRKRKHDEIWRVRLDYGKDAAGNRVQPVDPHDYPTKEAAERRLIEVLYEANRGPRLDPTRRTVAELIAEWLATEARGTVSDGSLEDYESKCRIHLLPAFGSMQVSKLTSGIIERWRAQKLAGGTGKRTISLCVLHLGQAMKYGVRHNYVGHNPVAALKPLRNDHREMQVWSAEQADRFLTLATGHMYHPIWHLALQTGMRKGELVGVQWGDVDWEGSVLRVRRSLSWAGGELKITDTKNRQARSIDLDRTTLRILREYRARQAERQLKAGPHWHEGDWLCVSNVGTPINPYNLTRELHPLQEKAGVPRIRFHDLRHTCASLLLARGIRVHVVSRQLGHANVAITMNIYAHLMEGQGREAAEVMERVLGQGR